MKAIKLLLISLLFVGFSAHAEDGVSRSAFTTAIEEKEPVDQLSEVTTDTTKIYFFTEILGMEGHTISHRWEYGGEVRAEVSFNIGANRWRVWSSKNLMASWTGEWSVSVVDAGGNIMSKETFNYVEAKSETESTTDESSTMTKE